MKGSSEQLSSSFTAPTRNPVPLLHHSLMIRDDPAHQFDEFTDRSVYSMHDRSVLMIITVLRLMSFFVFFKSE